METLNPVQPILNLIHYLQVLEEPIASFMDHQDGACYAYTQRGFRFDVSSLTPFQNPIQDDKNFHAYLLMVAQRRFFWLDQNLVEGHAGGWWLRAEFIPHFAPTFIWELQRVFPQLGPGRIVFEGN